MAIGSLSPLSREDRRTVRRREVGLQCIGAPAGRANFCNKAIGICRGAIVVNKDSSTSISECQSSGSSDTARRTGHKSNFSLKRLRFSQYLWTGGRVQKERCVFNKEFRILIL